MAFKAALLVCVSALLVQSISGRKCGCSCGCGISNSGGDLKTISIGPITPSGISVKSDLGLNGDLKVNGELPFLSAVAFKGKYDTKGSGCVDYSCGKCGNVGITSVISGSGCGCGCDSGCGCGCGSGWGY